MIIPITSSKAPKALGPYSQGVCYKDFFFSSGQLGIDPTTNSLISESIEEQTHQIFKNLNELLLKAQSNFEKVIKTTIYLQDIDDFSTVNKIYSQYIKRPYPSRSTIQVAKLPLSAKIEIEFIAIKA